ncbi:MAG: DsbC family protein [Gammaproteobacteria bacterium]|nr:DsbC family protein [Gammaproteobacteria bacterium]
MQRPPFFIALLATLWAFTTQASDLDTIQARLQKNVGNNSRVENVQPSAIPGLFSVKLDGQLVYVSKDARYLLQGSIFDVQSGKNLTTLAILDSIADKDTIVFSPKNPKHTLTIFTDTSCGYCRKLHQEVPKLNANGIKVRYLLYPRAGPNSQVGATLQSIWCAANPQQAMTTAKAGGSVPPKQCDNPIYKHIELAHQFGLRGTPMIITDSGQVIPGYQSAEQLIAGFDSAK